MKTVLICGGSSGLGLKIATKFEEKNFNVILNSRKKIENFNNFVKDMIEITESDLKKLGPDIVINNGFDKKNYFHSFEASINIVKTSVEYFITKGGGTIVNLNSFYGLYPDKKDPFYASAKYGLRGFVESIEEYAYQNNIKIINFYPRAIGVGLNQERDDIEDLINPEEFCNFLIENISYKSFYLSKVQVDRSN